MPPTTNSSFRLGTSWSWFAVIYIEKTRFEHRLNIEWEVDSHLEEEVYVPPLTIQPLVENAVRHGIQSRSRGGTVCIRIVDKGDSVEVSVRDNGAGMSEEEVASLLAFRADSPNSGIGLRNTERRLRQRYGSGLNIRSRPDEGTTVSFTVNK